MMKGISAAIAIGALAFSASASAAIVTYDSRIAFNAAVGDSTVDDLNDLAAGTSFVGTALDAGDFTMLRTGSIFSGQIMSGPDFFDIDGSNFARIDTATSIGDLVLTFSSPIAAFGLDANHLNDMEIRTNLTADSEPVPIGVLASNFPQFFGFTSDTAFTTLTFVSNAMGDSWGFDNVTYAGPADVPEVPVAEPSTLGLLGLGLLGLGMARRRRA